MSEITKIEAKIRGKYYTIVADEPEEYIYKICAQVDRKVSEICSTNPLLGTERASILAAINFADELHKISAGKDDLKNQINELQSKVYELERKLKMTGNINK